MAGTKKKSVNAKRSSLAVKEAVKASVKAASAKRPAIKKTTPSTSAPKSAARTAVAKSKLLSPVDIDILKRPMPSAIPARTHLRIGMHISTSGGVQTGVERAYRLGCNTLQIFSSSPRMWKAADLSRGHCDEMRQLREKYDVTPLVIHTSYLVNMCSVTSEFLDKSVVAFRGELQRALSLCAQYLVLHPGSFRGRDREDGLKCAADSIAKAADGLDLEGAGLKILIENTAGAEFSLGGSFEQVAELVARLRPVVPVGACIDTCHTHVAGYEITTREGFDRTMQQLDDTVGLKNVLVWHCNDAKAARGSKLDRHQHIGQGTIGLETFRWLLNHEKTQRAAFIAETPIDKPLDDERNLALLKSVVEAKRKATNPLVN